jgi:WD40 repeat protein
MQRSALMRLVVCCFIVICGLSILPATVSANGTLIDVCPPVGIQQRTPDFHPGGIILTTFDNSDIWVYNVDRDMRYPLPDTAPCGTNCHISYDFRWISYLNTEERAFGKMRLDGTQRTFLTRDANDVSWWAEDTLLVWTSAHEAYLRTENSEEREILNVQGVVNIQPGGYWGLRIEHQDEEFIRVLVNTKTQDLAWVTGQRIVLGNDVRYFNAASWSPDGQMMAFTAPHTYDSNAGITGAELFTIAPGDDQPIQWTDFNSVYGAVRINGHATGELSWSPDSSHLAFWVMEMIGPDPESNAGNAVIHILDTNSGNINVYCGFATTENTPNPPSLVWSPDGSHLVFGGNVPGDDKGYLLLALDIGEGTFTELSDGIFPALGNPGVIAWGLPPQ